MNIIRKRHILRIQIWILFLTSCVTNMNNNIILKRYSRIYSNIQIYWNIWKYSNLMLLLLTSLKIVDKISKPFCNFTYCYLGKIFKEKLIIFFFYCKWWIRSVANTFSDEWIWIWILFAKDVFYKYEYEYYSLHLVSRIWIRILFIENIHEYIRILKYIRIFENNQI